MSTTYTEDEIKAHAEALANMTVPDPTEADFALAEDEVRAFIAGGFIYDIDRGWHKPSGPARVPGLRGDGGVCASCGQPVKMMCMKGTGACSQQHQDDPSSS